MHCFFRFQTVIPKKAGQSQHCGKVCFFLWKILWKVWKSNEIAMLWEMWKTGNGNLIFYRIVPIFSIILMHYVLFTSASGMKQLECHSFRKGIHHTSSATHTAWKPVSAPLAMSAAHSFPEIPSAPAISNTGVVPSFGATGWENCKIYAPPEA